jgi:hypothetical protein
MAFQDLLPKDKTGSPATRLHRDYNVQSGGRSKIADWRTILEKASGDELLCRRLLRFIDRNLSSMPPSSETIAKRFDYYMLEMSTDPVASELPVTRMAYDIAERIAQDCVHAIEAEYVQAALNDYRSWLAKQPQDLLYNHLPPPSHFAYTWFTEIAVYGSPRMRRFSTEHSRWRTWYLSIKQYAMRG